MKIVILDGYTENPGDLSWAQLEAFGELTVYDRTPYETAEIIRRIGNAEIVVTNKVPLTREVLEACPNIRFIAVLATGYNVVDTACARERGIPVSNVPAYGTAAVGQFAIALLLEICSHVAHHSEAVHAGRWESAPDWTFWDYPLIELAGKTMGIVGFGRIGQTTGRVAKALGMNVLAAGSRETEAGREIARYVDRGELFASSDVICLHCPLFPETVGGLVVEQDLADALNSGKVLAAGLDVVSTEPIRADNPLLKAKNCFITPHISWAPKEARQRILDCTADNLRAFLDGKPIHVVN